MPIRKELLLVVEKEAWYFLLNESPYESYARKTKTTEEGFSSGREDIQELIFSLSFSYNCRFGPTSTVCARKVPNGIFLINAQVKPFAILLSTCNFSYASINYPLAYEYPLFVCYESVCFS